MGIHSPSLRQEDPGRRGGREEREDGQNPWPSLMDKLCVCPRAATETPVHRQNDTHLKEKVW